MRKYALLGGPIVLGAAIVLFFQNCSPAFKMDDHPSFHGNGGLNVPNDPLDPNDPPPTSFPPAWGEKEILSANTDGIAPKVTDYSGSPISGSSFFIANTELSSSGVKYEIRPVGTVVGNFTEESGVNTSGGTVAGLTYRTPISFGGREVFEVVAVDAQGDKSIKGKITLDSLRNPISIEIEGTVIDDDRKAYKFGVFTPAGDVFHKVRVKNSGTEAISTLGYNCVNTSYRFPVDAAIHPAPSPTQIAVGGTLNRLAIFASAGKAGVINGACTLYFRMGTRSFNRTVNFSSLALTGNLTPDFSPLSVKVNLVSLRNAAGTVAGNAAMLDQLLTILNRDFVFGGVKPITFVKGTYSVLESAHYDLKSEQSVRALASVDTPNEITYFVGRSFNTAGLLGQAEINARLGDGISIAVSLDGVQKFDGVAVAHELAHSMNLYHTAEASPAKTSHTLTAGERDFCKTAANVSTYSVTTPAAASAAAKRNIMYYMSAVNNVKAVDSFSTGTYATPMLNLVDCWKAINRIQF